MRHHGGVFRVLVVTVAIMGMLIALNDCARTDSRRVAAFPRWAWMLLITMLPVGGPVAWFVAGKLPAEAATPPSRPIAPDDNPAFLRDVNERLRWERERPHRDQSPPTSPSETDDGPTTDAQN